MEIKELMKPLARILTDKVEQGLRELRQLGIQSPEYEHVLKNIMDSIKIISSIKE